MARVRPATACTQQRQHNVRQRFVFLFLSIFSSVLQVCTTNMHILNSDPNKVFGLRAHLRKRKLQKKSYKLHSPTMTTRCMQNGAHDKDANIAMPNEMHNEMQSNEILDSYFKI